MSFITNLVQQAEDYIKQQIAAADVAGKLSAVEDEVLQTLDDGVTFLADAAHGALEGEITNNVLAVKIAELIQGHGGGKFKGALAASRPRFFLGFVRRGLARRVQREKHCSLGDAVALVNSKFPPTTEGDNLLTAECRKRGVTALGDGGFFDWIKAHLPDLLKLIEMLLPLILAL